MRLLNRGAQYEQNTTRAQPFGNTYSTNYALFSKLACGKDRYAERENCTLLWNRSTNHARRPVELNNGRESRRMLSLRIVNNAAL